MRVLSVDEARGSRSARTRSGARTTVEIELVDAGRSAATTLLVHAGVALARLEAAA